MKKLKYTKRKEIQRLMEEGCSIRKVKDLTGVPESTISRYKRVFGVFKPSIKIKRKNKISQLLERVLIRKFMSGTLKNSSQAVKYLINSQNV